MPLPLASTAVAFLSRLRHPTLFKIVLALMLLSWLLPDPVPFLDEIITGLSALLLANWRKPNPPVETRH